MYTVNRAERRISWVDICQRIKPATDPRPHQYAGSKQVVPDCADALAVQSTVPAAFGEMRKM